MSDGKQHITLKIDVHSVSMEVPCEHEQAYREAAQYLNQRYQLYAKRLTKASVEELWMYVALDAAFAWKRMAQAENLKPIEKRTEEMNRLIRQALGEATEQDDNE